MKKILVTILFLTAFGAGTVYACSCKTPSQLEEFQDSENVFVGRVVRQSDAGVEFKLIKSWKGVKVNNKITLRFLDLIGCNKDFEWTNGGEYLIYSYPVKDKSWPVISIDCGRSGPLGDPEWNRSWGDPQEDIQNMKTVAAKARRRASSPVQ